MYAHKQIDRAMEKAKKLRFGEEANLVIMSDCHRGDASYADNFAKNQNLYYSALRYYYNNHFTYIELGDGDELWENNKFSSITKEYRHIFDLMSTFHRQNRLWMVHGNHDAVKRSQPWAQNHLQQYLDTRERNMVPLFPGIKIYDSVLLYYGSLKKPFLLLHGHQADFFNNTLWRFSRFLVRYVWRPMQLVGVQDPFSASANPDKRKRVEKRLEEWSKQNCQVMVAGHTHRPVFPQPGQTLYFNDGSSVHPRCITALEIVKGNISLIKWCVETKDDGTLYVARSVLEGPARLSRYTCDGQIAEHLPR